MNIDKIEAPVCPQCNSANIYVEINTLVSSVSAGGCRTHKCYNGHCEEIISCHDCGYVNREERYIKANDNRQETVDRVLAEGGHSGLLKID